MTAAALLAPAAKADLVRCHMLLDLASPTLGHLSAASVELLDEGCLYTGLLSEGIAGARPPLPARSLSTSGEGFAALVDQGEPTRSLRLEIEGLALHPHEMPVLPRWEEILLTRKAPVDLLLDYHWDEPSREVRISTLDLDFGAEGRLHASGTIGEVDLRNADMAAVSVGSMGLTALDLEFTSLGLFETLLVPLFGPRLLADYASPEAGAEVLKASALDALANVPTSILDPVSLGALSAFVETLPEPSGRLSLKLEAAPGIGAPRLFGFAMTGVPRDAERFWAAFSGVTLRADWNGLPRPE